MKLFSAIYNDFHPFDKMGLFDAFDSVIHKKQMDTKDAALVVWGGGDISPSLYEKPVSRRTGAQERLSQRDFIEWNLMNGALDAGMPIIGICRGAQMLCALAGGFLVQDVTGHAMGGEHGIITKDGRSYPVNSLHHQMLYPFNVEHELMAWSSEKQSRHYIDVDEEGNDVKIEVPCEPEAVLFARQKGIGIQWHPEYLKLEHPSQEFTKELLTRVL